MAHEYDDVPAGTCLVGRGAQAVGTAVAEALGCVRLKVAKAADVPVAINAEQQHDWPIVFDCGRQRNRGRLGKLLRDRNRPRRCIVAASALVSKVLLLNGGWNVIASDSDLQLPDDVRQGAAEFLPAYLRDLLGRWCSLRDPCRDVPLRLLADMAVYVEQQGGDPEAVMAAADVVTSARSVDPSSVFIELLGHLVADGLLQLSPVRVPGVPTLIDNPGQDSILLNPAALDAALSAVLVEEIGTEQPVLWLQATGFFRGTNRAGWLLHRQAILDYWQDQGLLPQEALENAAPEVLGRPQ